MSTRDMTLDEIRTRGLAVLLSELGPVGYVRFMQQFENGSGDYTHDRDRWLDPLSAEQIRTLASENRSGAGDLCEPG